MSRRPHARLLLLGLAVAGAMGCAGGGGRPSSDPVARAAQTRRMYVSPGFFGAGDSLGSGLRPARRSDGVALSRGD